MEDEYFGTEEITAEDRAYNGSRFSEVRDAIRQIPTKRSGAATTSRVCPSIR